MTLEKSRATLRENVYNYLRSELASGNIEPGSYIDMPQLAKTLKVSKTPLRDALIVLEVEDIVTIYPRKGVMVNLVTMETIKHIYQIGSGLESVLMTSVFDYIAPVHLKKMRGVIKQAFDDFDKDDFSQAYDLNLQFHRVFHDLSDNAFLKRQLDGIFDRLFNFPARNFESPEVKEEERAYWREHEKMVDMIEAGAKVEVSDFLRDTHWQLKEEYTKALHVLLPK